jgi:hypothetical protein
MLAHDSRLKVGLFTSYQDEVVSSVLGMSPAVYRQQLISTTDQIHTDHPGTLKRYLIQGGSH